MEGGGTSNSQQEDDTKRAANSGINIGEANAINVDGQSLNLGQGFRPSLDQHVPLTSVIRIMRSVLPSHAKIADDAKEIVQEFVTEFISFITSEANEKCHQEHRRTVTAEDIISGMATLGFDDYIEPLSLYLQKYRAHQGQDRSVLPYSRRNASSSVQQPPVAPMAAPPSTTMNNGQPLPSADQEEDDIDFSQIDYLLFAENQSAGEGSSTGNNSQYPFSGFK